MSPAEWAEAEAREIAGRHSRLEELEALSGEVEYLEFVLDQLERRCDDDVARR